MGTDVYKTIFMGKEAYEVTKFSTQNVRTIIHPVGSAGPDPLDQYGSIGWKASMKVTFNEDLIYGEYWAAVKKWQDYFND
jgi:hypothetical protein